MSSHIEPAVGEAVPDPVPQCTARAALPTPAVPHAAAMATEADGSSAASVAGPGPGGSRASSRASSSSRSRNPPTTCGSPAGTLGSAESAGGSGAPGAMGASATETASAPHSSGTVSDGSSFRMR